MHEASAILLLLRWAEIPTLLHPPTHFDAILSCACHAWSMPKKGRVNDGGAVGSLPPEAEMPTLELLYALPKVGGLCHLAVLELLILDHR